MSYTQQSIVPKRMGRKSSQLWKEYETYRHNTWERHRRYAVRW